MLSKILDGLMRRYRERVPDVSAICQALVQEGVIANSEALENDHIAFRTMGVPQLGIQSLEKIFLHYGYQRRDPYQFPVKKLDAYWYSPPEVGLPRIFVSQLRVGDLSARSKQLIHSYTDEVANDPVDSLDLDDWQAVDEFLHRSLWRLPTLIDYKELLGESEFAAWVIYNRYYLNHFTISVHNFPPGYNTIVDFNRFLESRGFKLNDSGGKIKRSGDGLLIQSSTIAQMMDAEFDDGQGGRVKHPISGSYVEFVERRPIPGQTDSEGRPLRREGFEAASADRIFESTYSAQTERKSG